MRVTDEMVLAGAREVCARWSAACGVDPEDNWKIYSDEHKAEARAILTAALSHAAGQDGEQCRAASVSWDGYEAFEQFLAAEIDSAPEALRRLGDWLCNVLDDDHFATANRMVIGAMMETSAAIRALSRGVPEGMVLVPSEPTPEMETAHRMYGDTSDWWQAVTSAAIAAQRKEG